MVRFMTLLWLFGGGATAFVPFQRQMPAVVSRRGFSPSALFMAKRNERARAEKNFEDMMGDDWRVFRARLVANELVEAEENAKKPPQQVREYHHREEKKLVREIGPQSVGNLFAENCITVSAKKDKRQFQRSSVYNVDTVRDSLLDEIKPEDPFVSEAELPILLTPKASVDKRRWAHPIPNVEPGCVLVANENLGGVFHQTVVLVVDHHEKTGSTGIIINRPLEGNLLKVASETKSNLDMSLKVAFKSARVSYGGPAQTYLYTVLHDYGEVEGAHKLAPGVFVGGSEELMKEVKRNRFSPHDALFVKGYAAFEPGDLVKEIQSGFWYTAAVSSDFILRHAGATTLEHDTLWFDILNCMGGEYAEIAARNGGGDMRLMP